MVNTSELQPLVAYIESLPAVQQPVGHGQEPDGRWWVKFGIATEHALAWRVVQELAHVLNSVSIEERLPTVFKPVSPPPYMNGGPEQFLSWVIECNDPNFSPADAAQWLEGRLPRPVEDLSQWVISE
jgi:hypothetical protein